MCTPSSSIACSQQLLLRTCSELPAGWRLLWCLLIISSTCLATPAAVGQAPKLLEVEVPGGRFVGLPVHWSNLEGVVLESNGQFRIFDQTDVRGHRLLDADFSPQSLVEARNNLQAELGERYETLVYGPYVIAAPSGQVMRWRDRFNALLSGYLRYFDVRGWPLQRPDFPLCVTVFESREEFLRYAAKQYQQLPSSVVGSYFPRSNRCVLYNIDSNQGHGTSSTNWSETEATIVHEAVHQLAFNTGLHERLGMDPLWFVEGLATMFEQPSVYDPRHASLTIEQRMIGFRRQRLQPLWKQPEQLAPLLSRLVETDSPFSQQPDLAYDLSWALTFYLAERMPNALRDYTVRLSNRPFGDYPPHERVRDFQAAFGGDAAALAGQMARLYAQ